MSSSPATPQPFLFLLRNAGEDTHRHLTPAQKAGLAQHWNDWVETLSAQGKLKHASPLALTGRVVAGPTKRVTDGPYAETTEVVGGYFYVTAANLDEATEIARQCPGLQLGLTVEVRPIAAVSPVLEAVHGRPPKA